MNWKLPLLGIISFSLLSVLSFSAFAALKQHPCVERAFKEKGIDKVGQANLSLNKNSPQAVSIRKSCEKQHPRAVRSRGMKSTAMHSQGVHPRSGASKASVFDGCIFGHRCKCLGMKTNCTIQPCSVACP